ncbi:MAG TPA: potassium/proton antiporter [Limnochordales bacterium]
MAADTYAALQTVPIDRILLVASVLMGVSLVMARTAGRLGVPALVLFLLVGMLAGSEGPGGIDFDDPWLAQFIGTSALAIILFAGGLDTDWRHVRPVRWPAFLLATLGVAATAGLVGLFTWRVLGWNLLDGMLAGSVISSTDAAAVFMVLRSKRVALRGSLAPLLEFESASNDPMAILLTTFFIQLLTVPEVTALDMVRFFVVQIALGGVLGYLLGRLGVWLLHRMHFEQEALYPLLSLAIAIFIYGLAATVGGSGFLAVYLAGLVIGNSDLPYRRFLVRFTSSMAWLAQIVMFVALGLLVFPSELVRVAGVGMAVTGFLMFVARPAATIPFAILFRLNWREALLVAWVGLRGAVPIILATLPRVAGVASAQLIFNVVFFVVVVSCLVQGTSVPYVSRLLGVADHERARRRPPIELVPHEAMDSDLMEILVPEDSPLAGRPVAQLGLPRETLIVMLGRNGRYRVPTGTTTIHGGDLLFVLGPPRVLEAVRARFERTEPEPEEAPAEA